MRNPTRWPRLKRLVRMQCVGSVGGLSKLAMSPQITSLPCGCPACAAGGGGGSPRPRAAPPGAAGGGCCPATVVARVIATSAVPDRTETVFKRVVIDSLVLRGQRCRRPVRHHLACALPVSEIRCGKSSGTECRCPFHRASPPTAERSPAPDRPPAPCPR